MLVKVVMVLKYLSWKQQQEHSSRLDHPMVEKRTMKVVVVLRYLLWKQQEQEHSSLFDYYMVDEDERREKTRTRTRRRVNWGWWMAQLFFCFLSSAAPRSA